MIDDDGDDEVTKSGAPAPDRGVYGISVAAELSGINEQSLRLYERHGLLTPERSAGEPVATAQMIWFGWSASVSSSPRGQPRRHRSHPLAGRPQCRTRRP